MCVCVKLATYSNNCTGNVIIYDMPTFWCKEDVSTCRVRDSSSRLFKLVNIILTCHVKLDLTRSNSKSVGRPFYVQCPATRKC